LFFNFFDVKETGLLVYPLISAITHSSSLPFPDAGYIDLEELKLIVGCLLADEMTQASSSSTPFSSAPSPTPPEAAEPITVKNVEELFHTIDQNGSGKINFEEFLNFFETILRSPTLISSSGSRLVSSQH
jgi:hypothetical protein